MMDVLAPVRPYYHEVHGIECFPTYLTRVARTHGASPGQLAHLLSKLGASLGLADTDFQSSVPNNIWRLAGHTISSERLTRRMDFCMLGGRSRLTCTLKLGQALSQNHVGSVRPTPGYCPACLAEMVDEAEGELWIPLSWCLSVVTHCVVHGCELHSGLRNTRDLPSLPRIKSGTLGPELIWTHQAAHRICSYLADERSTNAPSDGYSSFLRELRDHFSDVSDFSFAIDAGLDLANVRRSLDQGSKPGLNTVFKVARRFSFSPLDVLMDGGKCLINGELFRRSSSGRAPRKSMMSRLYSDAERLAVRQQFVRILSSDDDLPSLREFAKDHGVSTNMLRYSFPELVERHILRWTAQQDSLRARKEQSARDAAAVYVKSLGVRISCKAAVAALMRSTGLPKHVLERAIRFALDPS